MVLYDGATLVANELFAGCTSIFYTFIFAHSLHLTLFRVFVGFLDSLNGFGIGFDGFKVGLNGVTDVVTVGLGKSGKEASISLLKESIGASIVGTIDGGYSGVGEASEDVADEDSSEYWSLTSDGRVDGVSLGVSVVL